MTDLVQLDRDGSVLRFLFLRGLRGRSFGFLVQVGRSKVPGGGQNRHDDQETVNLHPDLHGKPLEKLPATGASQAKAALRDPSSLYDTVGLLVPWEPESDAPLLRFPGPNR